MFAALRPTFESAFRPRHYVSSHFFSDCDRLNAIDNGNESEELDRWYDADK
jgi:hypothetical protein